MVGQIYWTLGAEECLASADPIGALTDYLATLKGQLAKLAGMARDSSIPKLYRKVLGALITLDVHARDIIQGMIDKECDSREKFEWTKQLRYSWDPEFAVGLQPRHFSERV